MTLPLLLTPLLYSCGDATGSIVGGDSLVMTMPTSTASGDGGSSGGGTTTNQTNADCIPGGTGAHGGDTWTDLYTCYFGTTGTDSCAGTGISCHATLQSAGGSFAWVCGSTSASCYTGMTGYGALQATSSMSDPTMAHLYGVLCGSPGGAGAMPLGCPSGTTLYADDFTRIANWIAAGAPNN